MILLAKLARENTTPSIEERLESLAKKYGEEYGGTARDYVHVSVNVGDRAVGSIGFVYSSPSGQAVIDFTPARVFYADWSRCSKAALPQALKAAAESLGREGLYSELYDGLKVDPAHPRPFETVPGVFDAKRASNADFPVVLEAFYLAARAVCHAAISSPKVKAMLGTIDCSDAWVDLAKSHIIACNYRHDAEAGLRAAVMESTISYLAAFSL